MGTPSDHDELVSLTVAGAATAIRRREISPVELTEAYLARIEAVNPVLNAYVSVTAVRARQDAARAQAELSRGVDRGPLHGIPIALKDLVDTAGIQTAGGAEVYRGRVPVADAVVAERLREAGSVLLGKTNTHELAFGVTTTNPHFGATRNPWDPSRVPGGSSGGSGAAVAARLTAAAIGTDTGGSIRIPASLCGCVGLMPTFGLVPKNGVIAMSYIADHVGPLTRTVEDAALVLEAIAGYHPGDPFSLAVGSPSLRAGLDAGVDGLRIGVPRSTMWALLDDEVRAANDVALDVLRSLGATVVDIDLPDHLPAVGAPGGPGFFSMVIEESRSAHGAAWAAHPEQFGPDLRAIYSVPPLSAPMLIASLEAIYAYAAAVRTALTTVDLLACPTVPTAAASIGAQTVSVGGLELPFINVAVANTVPYDMAGNPAITVPCGFTASGLPIGFQLAGRPLDEITVVRAAHAYERATTWHTASPSP